MSNPYAGLMDKVVFAAPTQPIQDALSKFLMEIRNHHNVMVGISGGSDSTIMVHIFSLLDPEKKTVYVYYNTGLEYAATKRHLKELEEKYGITIEWIDPIMPIPTCCRKYGVPFWSKRVSEYIYRLQRHDFKWEDEPFEVLLQKYPRCKSALKWWCNVFPKRDNGKESSLNIAYTPFLKEYIIANPPPPISAKCCEKAKKAPAAKYQAAHDFDLICTGVRKAEKGMRAENYKSCFTKGFAGPDSYRPLFWLSDKDKQDFKDHYGVAYSDCYEVWGMKRTGCPGCPYGKEFEQELDLMQKYEPKFYKAAINIFGASYEYTRGYLRFREQAKAAAAKTAGSEEVKNDPCAEN